MAVNDVHHEISISLRDVVGFLVRGSFVAVLLAVVAGSVTFLVSQRQPDVYRAESTLLLVQSAAGFTQLGLTPVTAPPIDASAYRVAAASDSVLSDALSRLGVAVPTTAEVRDLRERVGTQVSGSSRDSSLLVLEARAGTPDAAVAEANAVAAALVTWDRRRASESMSRVIATLEQQIEALVEQIRSVQVVGAPGEASQVDGLSRLRAEQQQQLAYARALIASAEGQVSVLQAAESTVRQIAPRPVLNTAIAAVLAMVAAYLVMILRVAVSTRLAGADDAAAATGLPILGEFPTVRDGDELRMKEASSYLRAKLLFATTDAHPKVFMVTSAQEGEGKTTVALHLAEGFVRYGYRTLLVDADLRSPSMLGHYSVVGSVGDVTSTMGWLTDPDGPNRILSIQLEKNGTLDLIPQFDRVLDAAEALGRGFARALTRWNMYDVIVIDAGPVLAVADPLIVAPSCTGTLLVVNPKRTDRPSVVSATQMLRGVGARVLGVVPNQVGGVRRRHEYGASYGREAKAPKRGRKHKEIARPAPIRDA